MAITTLLLSTAVMARAESLNVNLDQCANGVPRQTANCTWQNGDLNALNSQWREGDGVPFRVVFSGLTAGADHSVHINYDFIDNGKHAYDTLEDYNATIANPPIQDSLPTGVTFPSGSAITTAFPHDTTLTGYNPETGLSRHLTTYGASSVTMGALVHVGDTGDLVVNFHVPANSDGTVVMLWAGHLAIGATGWGVGLGAASINGAPFHMRTQQLDGSGNKNQDRSIQPAAIILLPSLTITKTADAGTVNAGQQIGYTITVSNAGPGDATGVKISDTVPTNTGLSWTVASQSAGWGGTCAISVGVLTCGGTSGVTLAAGGSLSVHITSPTTSASCGTVSNSASATSTNGGSDSAGPVAITVNCPTLSITKVADATTVNSGQTIGYTITVSNAGPGDATGVKLTDTLPTNSGLSWSIASQSSGWGGTCAINAGVLSCGGTSGVALASGASLSVHITSPTTAASCGTVSNSASAVSGNDGSPSVGPVSITVNCPALTITKVADATTVNAGDTIGYVITVHNNGPGDATGVKLTDTLPTNSGLSWSIASQSSGWGGTCAINTGVLSCGGTSGVALASGASLSVHITSPTTSASCGTVSNSASAVSGNDGSPSVGPVRITVNCPSVSITKVADSNAVKGGDTIGFTITVSNAGPGAAFGVKLSDALPSGGGLTWTITSASAGWGGTCGIDSGVLTCGGSGGVTLTSGGSLSVHISSPTTAAECGSTISNTGAVTLTNGTGGQDSDTIDVTCPVLSIHLAKDGPDAAHVGDTIHYTLTVTNGTDEPLFNITVTDPVCDGSPVYESGDTNNDGILQSGESWVYTCDHVVTDSDPDPLPNTATVVGQDKLGRETSAQASHSVDILHPSISIVKTANPVSGAPGDTVTYTYVVTNTSTDTTLFNVTVVDDKIPGIIGTIAELAPGQSVTLTKTATLPNAAGGLTNVGTASGADVLGKTVSAHDNATVTVVLAVPPLVRTGANTKATGLVGLLFMAVGIAMVTRKERGRVRPAFSTSGSVAAREVMLEAHRRSWRMRRRRGPATRARLRWRRSQGPPMRDGP